MHQNRVKRRQAEKHGLIARRPEPPGCAFPATKSCSKTNRAVRFMDGHEGMMWIRGHSSTPMCGGVDLIATDKLESPSARSMLRNETTDSRHAQPHPRRAAHV